MILNIIYIPNIILTYFFVLLFGNIISSIDMTIIDNPRLFAHVLKKSIITPLPIHHSSIRYFYY